MVIQDHQTRVNLILGVLRIILTLVNDHLLLQGKKKERALTVEETFNRKHHRQVILRVIQTQILMTMTTMTTKE